MDRPMLFGKYCLLERISVGGMAEVFRAKPLPAHESHKMLALKRILPHLAEDEEFITMFVDEAKLTVQLKHPNIVETYELGNFQSSYYILMEYIAGADVLTLQKQLRRRRRIMSVAQACYIAEGVARGLHYAHQACDEQGRPFNIIHRDVSPQNIRLTYDGRVKLIDFGIAKAAVQRTKTQVGVLKGKFGYMSPEQVRGEENIDHRSDVFALGTCLWEMLTNRRLFNGENEFETLQMVKHPDIPPPSEKNSQVPPEVDRIVMRALAADREERYQSAEDLAEELETFIQEIDQPYSKRHLAQWMADTFSEELAEERHKRQQWRDIETASDVKQFAARLEEEEDAEPVPSEARDQGGPQSGQQQPGQQEPDRQPAAQAEGAGEEDDQVWDPEFAPDEDEEDVDHEEFASNHTVVAAGGFDPSQFQGDQDDDIISLAEDDIIEVENEGHGEAQLEGDVEGGYIEEQSSGNASPVDLDEHPAAGGFQDAQQRAAGRQGAGGEARRAQVDAGGTSPGFQAAFEEEDDDEGVSTIRIASAAAAVLLMVGLAVAVGYTTLGSEEARGQAAGQKATLVVNVTPQPSREGEVMVDGYKKGTSTPVTIPDLEASEHLVEVRFPGFSSEQKEITLKGGELKTIDIELDRDPNALAHLTLEMPDGLNGAKVYLDGSLVERSEREGGLDVEPGKHLLEVLSPEHQPWSRVINVSGGESVVEQVEMRPRALTLRIEAGAGREIRVDGETVGQAQGKAEGLEPTELHEIAVIDGGRTVWRSVVGYPTIAQGVLNLDGEERPAELGEEDFGWLVATTGRDWWGVLVDGVPTGLKTPIEESAKIPVEAGERRVTFRRGNQMHKFDVEIEAGETVSVDETLSFEWSKPEL